ncbi:MAG TPA: tellurium resistance protein TerC, partial [Yinghuangia sp.]|nr:tellurium resistance protein TerC [Yinghuangia sp.]
LYFCLAGLLRRFAYLHYGLAVLLAFAGVKLILSETPVGKLPIPLTLSVIAVTITVSIAWSLIATRGEDGESGESASRTDHAADAQPHPATGTHASTPSADAHHPEGRP